MKRARILIAAVLAAVSVVMIVLASGALNRAALSRAEETNPHTIIYRNKVVNEDDIPTNNFNFGWDVYSKATEAVTNGDVSAPLEYIWRKSADGFEGDFIDALNTDPALCAAIALDIDERLNFEEKILEDEQDIAIGQRADKAHLHFIQDAAYWDRAVKLITERIALGEISIKSISGYKSSMYMYPDKLMGDRPSVIVRTSSNTGGHMLVVDFGEKVGVLKYRLECGYQPVDPTYWTPPGGSNPVDDGEDPTPDPPIETPDPEPELKPKDPNAGPQGQDPTNPDFGGGQNHDPDKTLTEEPQSPDSYTPPDPPESSAKPGQPAGDAIDTRDTVSGSKVVDEDNGKTEQHNGEEYHVVAGDGQDRTPLEEVYEQHNDNTVEEPLRSDPPAAAEIGAPE